MICHCLKYFFFLLSPANILLSILTLLFVHRRTCHRHRGCKPKYATDKTGHFATISSQFSAMYINIFHNIWSSTGLYLNWFKSCDTNEKTRKNTKIPKNITYTVLHIFRQVLFWAGNQGNYQISMITLVSSPKQHLRRDMQHSVCNACIQPEVKTLM